MRWEYSPAMDSWYLMGPWKAPDERLDPRGERQYAHIIVAPGRVHWACRDDVEPVKFFSLEEAKAYLIAVVRLT